MQSACFTHDGLGYFIGLCDGDQFSIEHTGEREQIVALVLQCDAHRANASWIPGLPARQFRDGEVEQRSPRGQGRPGRCQNVMAQPLS